MNGLLALVLVLAAPAPPRATIGDVLASADPLALVRIAGPTRPAPLGTETPVALVAAIKGTVPAHFAMLQSGPRRHVLVEGTEVIVALARRSDGHWQYRSEAAGPMVVEPRHRRAALGFVQRWRRVASAPLLTRAATWVALIDHASPVARSAAEEALLRDAPQLAGMLADPEIDALADVLVREEVAEETRSSALRVLDAIGGRRGADAVARRFELLPPTTGLQIRAATLLGRHASPTTTAALRRCVDHGAPTVTSQCRRLLGLGAAARTP